MTDAERAAAELAETLRRVNEELAANSRVSQATMDARRDAEMKAKYGIENFTAGTAKGAEAITSLASAGMSAGKAMLEGKKGAAAFNSTLDGLTTAVTAAGVALSLMVPVIGPLVAGFVLVTKAVVDYAKSANEMADKLYKGYAGLATAGAAAADGMAGVKSGAQKLGLSMNELSDYVQLISENSRELAQLGGTVADGRKTLENMGRAMEPAREAMLKMGLMPKELAEGQAAYLRMQTRIGTAQGKTVADLAEGARKYLVEQDALTKITGTSRKEAEKREETARAEEQYAGMLMKLRAKGDEAEIKRLTNMSQMMGSLDQDVAKAVRSLMTGYITPEGEKLLMNAPNALKDIQAFKDKQITQEQLADRVFKGMADTGARVSAEYATMGAGADTFMAASTQLNAMNIAAQGVEKSLKEAKAQQEAQGATGKAATDQMVENQAKLIAAEMAATRATEDFISKGIIPAQIAMKKLADLTTAGAQTLDELTPGGRKLSGAAKEVTSVVGGSAMGGTAGAVVGALVGLLGGPGGAIIGAKLGSIIGTGIGGYLLKNTAGQLIDKAQGTGPEGQPPGRAAGGPVDPGKLYKVGERGEEFFRPNVAGEIVPHDQISGIAGAANNRIEVIQRAAKEIADDTATLAKLTDVDLKKTQDASRLQDRLRKLKTELAIDEVELLEEQKDQLTKMLEAMEKSMGKDAAANLRKNITMQRAIGGGMGGGSGLQMPSAPSMPSMGGGQGLQIASQDDLKKLGLNIKAGDVQADNAKISPKLIELAKAIQGGVPGFGYFSSFNDKFHNEKAPSSKHTEGIALDFTVAQPPSIEDGKAITSWLKSMGASVAIDEYNSPTAKSTGGHFHAQLPTFADGGILGAGQLGIAGEAGQPELITGPAEITPINELMKAFGSLAGVMSQSVDKLDELVRAQKTNNDISNKILRVQQ